MSTTEAPASHASARTTRWAWALAGLALVMYAGGLVAVLVGDIPFQGQDLFILAFVVGFATVGLLIAHSPTPNPICWVYLAVAVSAGSGALSGGLALWWIAGGPVPDQIGRAAAVYADSAWVGWTLLPTTFLLLLFPNGRLPSPRWRWVAACAVLGLTSQVLAMLLRDGPLLDYPEVVNPIGIAGSGWLEPLGGISIIVAILGSAVSVVVRYRRSRGLERQQLKWLTFTGALAAPVVMVVTFGYDLIGAELANAIIQTAVLGVPLAAGVAILRYRLYDIDVVINRTLVYGALTAALALTYLGSVLLLQVALRPFTDSSDLAVAGSTLAVAGLFRPARERIQRVVDRRFYRQRYDAGRTVEAYSSGLRDQVDIATLLTGLQSTVERTVEPTHVSVWLREG